MRKWERSSPAAAKVNARRAGGHPGSEWKLLAAQKRPMVGKAVPVQPVDTM